MKTIRIPAPSFRWLFNFAGLRATPERILVFSQRSNLIDRAACFEERLTIQVVDLMLQATTEQAIALDDAFIAIEIEITHARERLARYVHADARQRQAAFSPQLRLAFERDDLGVDKVDRIGVVFRVSAVDDHKTLQDTHLRCCKSTSVVLVHGCRHTLGELFQGFIAWIARFADCLQAGIGSGYDLQCSQRKSLSQTVR